MPKACLNIPQDCHECFPLSISYCVPSIRIPCNLPLSPSPLYVWVRDKFDNLYYDIVAVQSDGSIWIDVTEFPDGMFSVGNGQLEIFLTYDEFGEEPVPMNFTSPASFCVILTVEAPTYFVDEDIFNIFMSEDENNFFTHE
jgi:hypothetical protein